MHKRIAKYQLKRKFGPNGIYIYIQRIGIRTSYVSVIIEKKTK